MAFTAHRKKREVLGLEPPRLGAMVILASLALNLLALGMPLVTLQIFDRVIPNQASETLMVLFIGLVIVALMELALRIARVHLIGHTAADFERQLSERVFEHTLTADPDALERDTTGAHFERFGAVAQLREQYSGQGRILLIDMPFAAIFIAMIALIGGWLALVPCIVLLSLMVGARLGAKRQQAVLDARKSVDTRRYSFLIEFFRKIATVKSGRMESQMLRRYEMLNKQSRSASEDLIRVSNMRQGFGAIMGQASVAAMGLSGAFFVIQNTIGVGDLAACMLLNGRTTQPMLRLMGMLGQREAQSQARAKLAEIEDLPRQSTMARSQNALRGTLSFNGLSGAQSEDGTPLFENLSNEVHAGEKVVFEGSGTAASHLFRLCLGERWPRDGTLRIDERAPQLVSNARGPGGIVLLETVPVIFQASIYENLSLLGAILDQEKIRETAWVLGIEEDIRALPMGYQTVLSFEGSVHSRAFLQRICLARALCMAPAILILDHATSALDGRTRHRAATALAGFEGAVLIATDQPDIAKLATRRIYLGGATRADAIEAWDADAAADRVKEGQAERKRA